MKLTPEDLQRIEEKKVANILRKIYTEKRTPTAREDAILHRAGLVQTPGTLPLAGYAGNWDELSLALGVSRRAIQEWRKDPRYGHDAPADRADGRKEIAAWQAFMVRHALKRADESVGGIADDEDAGGGDIQPPRVGGTQADWKTANLALDHRRKENAIGVQEGRLLVASELEVPLGAMLATFQTKGAAFPSRVARHLAGLREVGEIEDKLREELDADFGDLQFAGYLAVDAIAAAVAAVPFDDETAALCEKLLRGGGGDKRGTEPGEAGSDRPALLELAGAIATQALRLMGQRAIADTKCTEPCGAAPAPSAVDGDPPPGIDRRSAVESPHPAAPPTAGPAETADPKAASLPPAPAKKGKKSRSRAQPATSTAEVEASAPNPPRRRRTGQAEAGKWASSRKKTRRRRG